MMAFYVDEEEIWKCLKHPSKRRRTGICPACLRERLLALCLDCANVRPCGCASVTTSASSSSSSSFSSFSRFFYSGDVSGVDEIGRVSNLIDSEPAFRRSRSLAIPFLRSRSRFVGEIDCNSNSERNTPAVNRSRLSFWSAFKIQKGVKCEEKQDETKKSEIEEDEVLPRRLMMLKSRSVAVVADSGGVDLRSPAKSRGWHFPSPMNVFRHRKIPKVVQSLSPLHRG